MSRMLSALSGLLLIAVAFGAGTRVADTREGLIAEIVTLLAGLAGVGLLLYGLVPKRRTATTAERSAPAPARRSRRSANDLLLGAAGVAVTILLFGGLFISGGWIWAALGGVLMVPMLAGSIYLLVAFARAPEHDWTVDLARLFRPGPGG